jgi:hypothetical protein
MQRLSVAPIAVMLSLLWIAPVIGSATNARVRGSYQGVLPNLTRESASSRYEKGDPAEFARHAVEKEQHAAGKAFLPATNGVGDGTSGHDRPLTAP